MKSFVKNRLVNLLAIFIVSIVLSLTYLSIYTRKNIQTTIQIKEISVTPKVIVNNK